MEGALLAVVAAVIVSLVGWLILRYIPRSALPAAAIVAALTPVIAIGVGIYVTATAMFISPHDFQVLIVVLLACTPFAVIFGLVLARRVRQIQVDATAEQMVIEQERALEISRRELIAWVSHDLRTPLAGLRAMAEALEDGVVSNPDDYHRRMVVEVDSLAQLVDDLFEVARLQAGTIRYSADRVGLADLVSDALATHDPVAKARGVRLLGRAETTGTVLGDNRELSRALGNLIVNAIRATPTDGVVEVVATQVDDQLLLQVTDAFAESSRPTVARSTLRTLAMVAALKSDCRRWRHEQRIGPRGLDPDRSRLVQRFGSGLGRPGDRRCAHHS